MKSSYTMLRRGFTLLELLIVIAIIGILVAVSAASYSSAQSKSRDSRRKSDMKAWQNGLEQFYATNGEYPDTGAGTTTCNPGATIMPAGVPGDPQPSADYAVSTCTDVAYCVCATMEQVTAGNSGAACSWAATTHFCVGNLQ